MKMWNELNIIKTSYDMEDWNDYLLRHKKKHLERYSVINAELTYGSLAHSLNGISSLPHISANNI